MAGGLRATSAIRATRGLASTIMKPATSTMTKSITTTSAKAFSSSQKASAADHGAHEEPYDPPSGWLFGVKPGEKAEKEGWEGLFIYGFFGTLGLGVVGYAFKPDTSYVLHFILFVFISNGSGIRTGLVQDREGEKLPWSPAMTVVA
jgi:hypothetical protein